MEQITTNTILVRTAGKSEQLQITGQTHLTYVFNTAYALRQEPRVLEFDLLTAGATLEILGLDLGYVDAQHTKIIIRHQVANTTSQTLVKSVLSGNAVSELQGMILVAPQADGTQAYLQHHSLLFATDPKQLPQSVSVPALEILADDVKASHASTISTVNPDDLFYLQSRGLTAETARQLCLESFLQQACNSLSTNAARLSARRLLKVTFKRWQGSQKVKNKLL